LDLALDFARLVERSSMSWLEGTPLVFHLW